MELMKNGLAEPAIKRIAFALSKVLIKFSSEKFIALSLDNIEQLELKERVQHLIKVIHTFMPNDFPQAAILLVMAKDHWDFGEEDDALSSFAAWPLIDYIAEFGLKHPDESLTALKELTELFSAEFAIRPFIINHTAYCHQQFKLWVVDDNEHVRRLVSEGTRPRLPWGLQLKQFINEPSPNIPLLSQLHQDDSLYVRRSVANHLNDIAKDNPDVVISTCQLWQTSTKDKIKTQWVIKHATRSLIKSGNQEAFALLGFTKKTSLALSGLNLSSQKVIIGDSINFDFELASTSNNTQNLVIDYAIHFMKANNQQRAKVFKLKTLTLNANDKVRLSKKHSFKLITTRKYYPGEHIIEILINGKSFSKYKFNLAASAI